MRFGVALLHDIRTQLWCGSRYLLAILVMLGLMAPPSSGANTRTPAAGGPNIGPRCAISPSSPVAVPAAGTYSFTASNCGTGTLSWQVSGAGTIDASGNYAAPASVQAQNQSRGCQELPNNSPFNIPVNQLPVDPHSARWITRITENGAQYPDYHSLKFFTQLLGFYDNPVDGNTAQELMHFLYPDRSHWLSGFLLSDSDRTQPANAERSVA